LAEYLFQGINK